MSEHRDNPLNAWMERTHTTAEALSEKVIAAGGKASPKYIDHIANDRMPPGYRLCEVLETITGIDHRTLKSWPHYKRAKHAA